MKTQSLRMLSARLLVSAVCGCLWLPALAGDPPPVAGTTVKVVASDPIALEGSSTGAFTVVREGDFTADLAVDLEIGGTATNGVDYALITNHISIPAGFAALDLVVQPLSLPLTPTDKTVRLTVLTNASYTVGLKKSAVVTIVENRFNDQPPSVQITSPTNGTVVTTSKIDITAEATDQDDSIQSVSFFDGDHLLGSVTTAPYVYTWTGVGAGKHSLFAKATDAAGLSAFSKAVSISVADVPPTVLLTNPTNGSVFGSGPITLAVTATDPNDSVVKVSFWANDRLLGDTTIAPFALTVSNMPPGRYVLFARAFDGFGAHAVSQTVSIRVTNAPPVVKLTSPTNSTVLVAPATFTLTADASDPDGSVKQVSFYANDHLLGRVTAAPYTYIWDKVPVGRYVITAVATDNQGTSSVPDYVKVQVNKSGP